jgi:hypothetical protein
VRESPPPHRRLCSRSLYGLHGSPPLSFLFLFAPDTHLVCGSIIIIIIARLRGVHDGALLSSLYCLFLSSVVVMLMGCVLYLSCLPYHCIRFRRGSGALVRLLPPLLDCNWIATGRVPLLRLSTLGALSLSLFSRSWR